VRINYEGLLPYTISAFLGNYQQTKWKNSDDNRPVAEEISSVISGQVQPGTGILQTKSIPVSFSEDGRALYSKEERQQPLPEFDPRSLDELDEPGDRSGWGSFLHRTSFRENSKGHCQNGETVTIRASDKRAKAHFWLEGFITLFHCKYRIYRFAEYRT
jgi:hypothetical protein